MPWLLYRYILGEFLRVFILSGGVLVTVIAFGAAIKPLAADDLLGPAQTAKYIAFATVPMLQFALPFAAGFAATLVFHRLANDNEIQAAAVSGISYQRILMPIVAIGIVLVLIMVVLTHYVIPQFWAKMEQYISADITQLFRSTIEKGIPYQLGDDIQIYADGIYEVKDPETGAQTRLILIGVAAAELDSEGRVTTDVTATRAIVDIHIQDKYKYIQLELHDTVVYSPKTGELVEMPIVQPDPILIPSVSSDRPELMTIFDMLDLREKPDDFSTVIEAKNNLALALRQIEVWDQITEKLESEGQIELIDEQHSIIVKAQKIRKGKFSGPAKDPITILVSNKTGTDVLFSSKKVSLAFDDGSSLASPSLELVIENYEILDANTGELVNQQDHAEFGSLEPVGLSESSQEKLDLSQLLDNAQGATGNVASKAKILNIRIDDLLLQINSKIQRRFALSATAILLLLLGTTLAMVLRDSLPLVIYAWAFAPSILDIIMISGGGHMVRDGSVVSGSVVLWLGNAILVAMIIGAIRKLMRN